MIRASDWRPVQKNSLQGFCTLHLAPSGIVINDCSLHRMPDGREWIGLPAKPQIDRDGQQRKDPTTGKPLYVAIVEVRGKAERERFQQAALAAVHVLLDTERVAAPTSASWLNAVEGFFAKLTRQRLKRGVFKGIADLQAAINRFLRETNENPKPFIWTADPDDIIEKVRRGKQALESIH